MDPERVTVSVKGKINKGRWFEADGGDNEGRKWKCDAVDVDEKEEKEYNKGKEGKGFERGR